MLKIVFLFIFTILIEKNFSQNIVNNAGFEENLSDSFVIHGLNYYNSINKPIISHWFDYFNSIFTLYYFHSSNKYQTLNLDSFANLSDLRLCKTSYNSKAHIVLTGEILRSASTGKKGDKNGILYDTFPNSRKFITFKGFMHFNGLSQQLKINLNPTKYYYLSYRIRQGGPIGDTIVNVTKYSYFLDTRKISHLTTFFSNSRVNPRNEVFPFLKEVYKLNYDSSLVDTILDSSYNWRKFEVKFKPDSNYQYINFGYITDHSLLKTDFFDFLNKKTGDNNLDFLIERAITKGVSFHFATSIDDIRLLTEEQYLKTTEDQYLCIDAPSTTLRVLSGAGPYSWRKAGIPNAILSTSDSLVVSPTDTMEIYEVLSPYDTASVVVYLNKNKITISDTTYLSNCNNVPIIVNTPNNAKWSDGIVSFGSRTFNNSGNYFYTQKVNCSTKIKNYFISIQKVFKDTFKAELCSSPYIFRGKQYDTSGIFTINYPSQYGCDSSYTLDLKIKIVNNKIQHSGFEYTSLFTGADSYQWYLCSPSWRKIAGATSQTLTTTTKSHFAVVINYKGCTDTSDCISWNSSGIATLNENLFKIYPNPFSNVLYIYNYENTNRITYNIRDLLGRPIIANEQLEKGENKLDLTQLSKGIYLLELEIDGNLEIHKIIKISP